MMTLFRFWRKISFECAYIASGENLNSKKKIFNFLIEVIFFAFFNLKYFTVEISLYIIIS